MDKSITELIAAFRKLSTEYRVRLKKKDANGENYNIFKVLKIQNREVTTHSAVIADLLDPKGSHGQGPLYLDLFLQQLNRTTITNFESANADVKVEFHIGPRTETEGGRVDISIFSNEQKILIENKIYASDQANQLSRYRKYSSSAILLYLTLDGRESSESDLIAGKDYFCISYKDDILNWIQECIDNSLDKQEIKATLTQYLSIIKELTNQSMDVKMKEEIVESILSNEDNFRAFQLIRDSDSLVTKKVLSKLDKDIAEIAESYSLKQLNKPINLSGKASDNFGFTTDRLKQIGENLAVQFQFDYSNYQGFKFGIARTKLPDSIEHQNQFSERESILIEAFRREFQESRTNPPWWLADQHWNDYLNWDTETFGKLYFENTFKSEFDKLIQRIISVLQEV